jgi:hypothetical protein
MKISELSSDHMMAIEAMKSQLLIVLVNRLGGETEIPVAEIDGTGRFNMTMHLDEASRSFRFKVVAK